LYYKVKAASQKYLIVTADDFGLHQAVNVAVEKASRARIVNAASLMVSAPAAADAVRRARQLPQLGVGLHIVLADGRPTLEPKQIPALLDSHGNFGNRMLLQGVRFFALPAVRAQLEAEIRAQFAAFARTGLTLDHVNTHKHFHFHPTVLSILLRVGKEYGSPPMRVPAEPWWFAARRGPLPARIGNLMLLPLIALMRRRLRRAQVFHNQQIFGIANSGAMDEASLLAILERLPAGVSEIYWHPATISGGAIAVSMSDYRHARELAALLDPRVRQAICGVVARGGYRDMHQLSARLA
jgi:chitin disaccharide deacetylase